MTQDPKKLPSWLKGKQKPPEDPPPEPPEASAADADADIPPWLREDQPPPPSRVKRVAPPTPEQRGTGGLPPWLAGGEEEPPQPKSYKIGGTELPEEYFTAADTLADTTDSDMTYDTWIANQVESRREKDIEEEVPDDLLSAIQDEPAQKGTGPLKPTGQLPDWFLGLEALDTTEAPEWFVDEEAPQQPASAAAPLWMSDMMDEPAEPEDELPSADEIGSFFTALGGTPQADDEETPEIDWYDQADTPDEPAQALGDDFFAQLVGGGEPSGSVAPASNPYNALPDYDAFEDFEDFNDEVEQPSQPAQGSVEIPQNELDAFFSNVASGRGQEPVSLDDIEDPEMEWLSEPEPVIPEPEPYIPPEAPAELTEENNSWLSELQGIVSGATRPLQSLPEEDVARLGTRNLDPDWANTSGQSNTAAEDFSWPAPHVDEPEPEVEPEADWFSGITPADEATDFAQTPEDAAPSRSRMTERLNREPEPVASADGDLDQWDSLINATQPASESLLDEVPEPSDDSLFESDAIIPAAELQTGWLRDDLFADEAAPAAENAVAAESDADFFSLLAADSDANLLDEPAQPQSQWSDEQALSEADFMSTLDQPASASASTDLYSGWQNEQQPELAAEEEDALGQWQNEQPAEAASLEDLYAGWQNEQQSAEPAESAGEQDDLAMPDLFTQWETEQNAASAPSEALFSDWQNEQNAETSEADHEAFAGSQDDLAMPDLFAQWQTEQAAETTESDSEALYASEQEDDFFANLNLDEQDNAQPAASTEDLYAGWQNEQQPAETAAQEDDFFAALGMDQQTEQPAASTTEDLYAGWQNEQQPAEAATQDDDFFAALGMDENDARPAASTTEDLYAGWQNEQQPAEAAPADADDLDMPDLFGQWEAEQADDTVSAPQEDDFFSVLDIGGREEEDEQPAAFANDDLFTQWQKQQSDDTTDDAVVGESLAPDDFFASLGMVGDEDEAQPAAVAEDPFANWDTQAEVPPSEDFFSVLDTMVENQPIHWEDPDEAAEPDFFSTLAEPQPQVFTDVDSYLASLSNEPTDDMLEAPYQQDDEIDLDALFADAVAPSQPRSPLQQQIDSLPGADEEWLAQLGSSVGEVSASAIVRQKEDRPVEELSDRMKKLRARAEEIPEGAFDEDNDALAPTPFVAGTPGLAQGVVLTPEQEKQVALLRALVPSDDKQQPSRMSAIEATYDSPFMPDLEDTPETTLQPLKADKPAKVRRRARRRRRLNIRFDRFLVAVVLAAAVILPFFVPGFRIGTLPPSNFAAGSSGQVVFDQIDALQSGDLVLVGVEYGASAAAELDGVTEALLRHIFMRSAIPVVISSNPVGLLRSEARFTAISLDLDFLRRISAVQPLTANNDYYVVRYLPGSVIGLRAFSGDTANLLLTDIRGQATNLVVRSLSDFALVTVITDRAEDLRAYAEQIAPLTRAPLVSAVSYGAAPLVEPYARALGGGLLVGYADTYTYTDLLDTVTARSIAQRVRIVPTLEPTLPPSVSDPAGAEAAQPAIRATGIRATPTIAPSPTPVLDTATVNSDSAVNLRIGPSTENPVLATVPPGTVLPVLGISGDGAWVNVRLQDGREGWISASLLTISSAQSAAPKLEIYGKRQQVDEGEEESPTPRPPTATRVFPTFAPTSETETLVSPAETEQASTATPRPTRTPIPSATATERPTARATSEVTAEATAEATVEVTEEIAAVAAPPPPPSPGYRDERWYAMNLGVIVSALIITLGMVVNLVRGLLRRGQRA